MGIFSHPLDSDLSAKLITSCRALGVLLPQNKKHMQFYCHKHMVVKALLFANSFTSIAPEFPSENAALELLAHS